MYQKTTLAILTMASILTTAPVAFAADEYNVSSGLTAVGKPLGMHGVDPVTFINLGNRIDGAATFTAKHDGVAYYFSSAESMKKFKANPSTYLPENGGFCTYGVSVGKKFDGNPKYAAVIDNKLYLFLSQDIFRAFQKDKVGTIKKAAANWKKIRSTAATKL